MDSESINLHDIVDFIGRIIELIKKPFGVKYERKTIMVYKSMQRMSELLSCLAWGP